MQFQGNLAKSYVGTLLEGWHPHLGEILDPPLISEEGGKNEKLTIEPPSRKFFTCLIVPVVLISDDAALGRNVLANPGSVTFVLFSVKLKNVFGGFLETMVKSKCNPNIPPFNCKGPPLRGLQL